MLYLFQEPVKQIKLEEGVEEGLDSTPVSPAQSEVKRFEKYCFFYNSNKIDLQQNLFKIKVGKPFLIMIVQLTGVILKQPTLMGVMQFHEFEYLNNLLFP